MLSTEELVKAVKSSDMDAFSELVRRYERTVIITAWAITSDFHIAQDVAQEAFVIAYQQLHQLREAKGFGPWILRIVKREAVRSGKTSRRETGEPFHLPETFVAPDSWWREFEEIVPLLAQLPDQERVVMTLRYLDGLSVREIAETTGRPSGTVTKQLLRAIQRLRSLLIEVDQ